jgi:hypothetical protein
MVSFLAVALFPLLLAGYGGHLAAKAFPGEEKAFALKIVWGLAILGVITSGVQQFLAYQTDYKNEGKQSDLREEVHGLRSNTSYLINTMAGIFSMVTSLNADLATLRRDTEAAKEHHDPRMIADLQTQAQVAQQRADSLSHELLVITMVPQIIRQLQEWPSERRARQQDLHARAWEEHLHWLERNPKGSSDTEAQMQGRYQDAYEQADKKSLEELSTLIKTADLVRSELLRLIPQANQTPEDKQQAITFSRGIVNPEPFPLDVSVIYLQKLAMRIPAPR